MLSVLLTPMPSKTKPKSVLVPSQAFLEVILAMLFKAQTCDHIFKLVSTVDLSSSGLQVTFERRKSLVFHSLGAVR